jgi:hypothetical protein
LHAGGAIGPEGPAGGVEVSLPDSLARFGLPDLPSGVGLREAVRASLRLTDLGPERLTFPLLAAAYRAVLGDTDFALHLAGPTGTYKTEAAALVQQHFGAGLDARHLPGGWSSTGNALEGLAFAAKDALLVIDDFAPSGSSNDVQRYHREAERLLRAQGNRAGRQRMRADATVRPGKPPRGLLLSTGEDVPRGQSLRARLLVLETSPGDFGSQPPAPNPTLSACQRDAAAGKYAVAMAGFIRWLAPEFAEIRGRLRSQLLDLRDHAGGDGQHARTPGLVADLALGLRYLLRFGRSVGAISREEKNRLWKRGWAALVEAAREHAKHIAGSEPTGMFLRLLSAALASGRAHVAGADGEQPQDPGRWGWRPGSQDWQPQGRRVGWVDGAALYLEPEASYAEAQRLAVEQGESLTVSAHTLRRRLGEKALLATRDEQRQKLTVRRTLEGVRRDVLHLHAASLASAYKTGPTGPAAMNHREKGPVPGAGSHCRNGQPARDTGPKAREKRYSGPVGPVGKGEDDPAEDDPAEDEPAGEPARHVPDIAARMYRDWARQRRKKGLPWNNGAWIDYLRRNEAGFNG